MDTNSFILNTDNLETCVVCKKETKVNRNTPVDLRFHYIDGVGELCADCHYSIRNTHQR